MKKRIIIVLLIFILFTTGCTCDYKLKIEGTTYKEEVTIWATGGESISSKYTIPIDKEIYNCQGDSDGNNYADSELYDYKINGNSVTFNYDFNMSAYSKSSAASECYNTVTASSYNGSVIISTGSKANCFDKYPTLDSVTVRIDVDRKVISHNADSVSGNVYTWNLTRNNANNKGINMVLGETIGADKPSNSSSGNASNNNSANNQIIGKKNYFPYIFAGIMLILFGIGYLIFKTIKNNENNVDV